MKPDKLKAQAPLIGLVLLILLDLAGIWPVYETYIEDPRATLPPPVAAPAIQLEEEGKVDEGTGKTSPPSAKLLQWDPFWRPNFDPVVKPPEGGEGEEVVIQTLTPVPVEGLKILGIIKLNGRYRALVSIQDEPSVELVIGSGVPGKEGMKVIDIQPSGVRFGQEGYLPNVLSLDQPALSGRQWYQGADDESIRGKVRLQ